MLAEITFLPPAFWCRIGVTSYKKRWGGKIVYSGGFSCTLGSILRLQIPFQYPGQRTALLRTLSQRPQKSIQGKSAHLKALLQQRDFVSAPRTAKGHSHGIPLQAKVVMMKGNPTPWRYLPKAGRPVTMQILQNEGGGAKEERRRQKSEQKFYI